MFFCRFYPTVPVTFSITLPTGCACSPSSCHAFSFACQLPSLLPFLFLCLLLPSFTLFCSHLAFLASCLLSLSHHSNPASASMCASVSLPSSFIRPFQVSYVNPTTISGSLSPSPLLLLLIAHHPFSPCPASFGGCSPVQFSTYLLLSLPLTMFLFCPSVGPSVCPSVCLSVCMSVCMSVCPSVFLYVCLSICLSV